MMASNDTRPLHSLHEDERSTLKFQFSVVAIRKYFLQMIFVFIFTGFISICQGATKSTCALEDDLAEFVNLFPGDEYTAILHDYLKHDAAYKQSHDYLSSEDFEELFAQVRLSSEYRAIMKYLDDIGYPGLLNLGEHHEPAPRPPKKPRSGTGFHSLVRDVISILPHDNTSRLLQRKLQGNECFRTFVDQVQGLEFQALLTDLEKTAEYGELKEKLHKHGIDIHDIYYMYEQVLGFEIFSTVEEAWDSYRVKTEL